MYVSRLAFHTAPGKTAEAERQLMHLAELVLGAGGAKCRVLRAHYASLGAPDLVFEQEAADIAALEHEMDLITSSADFQAWSERTSTLLVASPKREVYLVSGERTERALGDGGG